MTTVYAILLEVGDYYKYEELVEIVATKEIAEARVKSLTAKNGGEYGWEEHKVISEIPEFNIGDRVTFNDPKHGKFLCEVTNVTDTYIHVSKRETNGLQWACIIPKDKAYEFIS